MLSEEGGRVFSECYQRQEDEGEDLCKKTVIISFTVCIIKIMIIDFRKGAEYMSEPRKRMYCFFVLSITVFFFS